MIKEDYVSFETAKLLKEKGFDEKTMTYYEDKILCNGDWCKWNRSPLGHTAAPTHQMAMKWLREVYDLHIISYPYKVDNEEKANHWCCEVYKSFNLLGYEKYINETPKSYEEAVEAALKYSLENLI